MKKFTGLAMAITGGDTPTDFVECMRVSFGGSQSHASKEDISISQVKKKITSLAVYGPNSTYFP